MTVPCTRFRTTRVLFLLDTEAAARPLVCMHAAHKSIVEGGAQAGLDGEGEGEGEGGQGGERRNGIALRGI